VLVAAKATMRVDNGVITMLIFDPPETAFCFSSECAQGRVLLLKRGPLMSLNVCVLLFAYTHAKAKEKPSKTNVWRCSNALFGVFECAAGKNNIFSHCDVYHIPIQKW
jgi:hypothetical protein